MTSPSKEQGDRRKSERRIDAAEASARPLEAERREGDQRGVADAMVDALEDILRWERASERAIRVAASTAKDAPSSSAGADASR